MVRCAFLQFFMCIIYVGFSYNDMVYVIGDEIRGGSTAVFVDDGYLLMFHTISMDYGSRNYFMGAMHLCPHPPFKIRAMSAYPIVKSHW